MVVDTGTCFTIVRPAIHEVKINFGQYEFNHLVLVANITDDVCCKERTYPEP